MKPILLPPLDDNGNLLFDDWTEPIVVESNEATVQDYEQALSDLGVSV